MMGLRISKQFGKQIFEESPPGRSLGLLAVAPDLCGVLKSLSNAPA